MDTVAVLLMLYPTAAHEAAARYVVEQLKDDTTIKAILLTCSCARGKALPESCLDIALLVDPMPRDKIKTLGKELEIKFSHEGAIKVLESMGKWCGLHLSVFDGNFKPGYHGWESGPDDFELEIGNYLAHSVPLLEKDGSFNELKDNWLPYYDEDLRQTRLSEKIKFFTNNLDHVPDLARRGLFFAGFNRLYNAHKEFLQALFITRKTYPISYVKWVEDQITGILALPELLPPFKASLEFPALNEAVLLEKRGILSRLGCKYLGLDGS